MVRKPPRTTAVAVPGKNSVFDFTGVAATVTGITVIFDNGTVGDAAGDPDNWTFQYDDIQQTSATCPPTGGGGSFDTITFDDPAVTYTLTDFGGNASVVTNDPAGGTNMVAQSIKTDTAETWAGTTVSTEANEAIPTIPLDAANTQMTVRVYSPDVGIPVRLKIEDASDNTITVETEATTTVAGAWETLTFDFANEAAGTAAFNPANTYNKVSIFFNFGTTGADAGEKTYYFDDIDVLAGTGGGGGDPTSARALTDFEDAGAPYTFSDFDGGVGTVIDNPDASGIDTSARVGQMEKFAGQAWGGTTLDMGGDVDWSGGEVWTMKIRSSRVVPVLFKWEGLNQERSVDHGGSGTWEELCFDFTGATGGAAATALTLIFDLGVMGDAAGDPANWTFQFDDITQVASCPGSGGGGATGELAVNGDFEEGDLNGWTIFDSSNSPNGGNITVVQPGSDGTGFAGNINITAPGNPTLKQANLAAGQLTPGQQVTVSFDWKGTDANGGVVDAVLFSELGAGGVSQTDQILSGGGFPADWTTVGPLDITIGTDVSGGVTLQIAAICGGAAGCESNIFIDNVSITTQ